MKRDKGIKFERMNENEATQYLRAKNNYFRLASYRTNYDKHLSGANSGKYIDLDFSDLVELSTIDMHIRFLVIKMCLDLEHCLKVQLLEHLVINSEEDGYDIVTTFLNKNEWIVTDIFRKRKSSYVGNLINKFFNFEYRISNNNNIIFDKKEVSCPMWAFLEIIAIGEFIKFYDFYYESYPQRRNYIGELNSVKSLRNACAHNNCIIHNLRKCRTKPGQRISQFIASIPGIGQDERKGRLSSRPVYEFVCLMYLYNEIVTDTIKVRRYEELKELVYTRMRKHGDYFENQQIIKASYIFLKKVVDFLT